MTKLESFIANNEMVARAADLAREAHEGQTYDNGPYFENHVLKVAGRVADAGFDFPTVMVALLHDVVEDTDVTLQEIYDKFGLIVMNGVGDMTHDGDVSYMNYLMDIENHHAIVVKYMDMTENLSNNPSPKNKMKYEMGLDYFRRVHPQYVKYL